MQDSGTTLVAMSNISKSYPGVQALKDVHFELRAGEIHCLVGENGAGKSTLMRILSGAEQPDSGSVVIDGRRHHALDPILGHQLGIGVIYQETDLVLKMTVAENMFLGHEPRTGYGALDRRRMNDEAQAILQRIGVEIPPATLVRTLSPSNRQLVQIAKALSWRSKVLVMDEPGAALSDHELDRLFAMLNLLIGQGIGVIYISHRLGEILRIGHRVTVLRDGEHVATAPVNEVDLDQLIHWMVGRPLGEQYGKQAAWTEEVVLAVRHLSVPGHFEDVSLDLHAGEVLGLAGLVGAGRSALLGCLFGAVRPTQGAIYLGQRTVQFGSPHDAVQLGLGLVPEDRRESGLVLSQSVQQNIALPILDRVTAFLVVNRRRLGHIAQSFVDSLNIRTPSVQQRVQNLSGGNQQKVVVAKWLAAGVKILLLDEPTRGIDVGAKAEIYRLINEMTGQGMSIIMASSELPEVLGMSDRILVMAGGRITQELWPQVTNQAEIMQYAVPHTAQAA